MKSVSRVRLFATSWTVAYQASPSMGFSRHKYWSGLPFPSPGDLSDPGIEPRSPALEEDTLTSEPPGKIVESVGDVIMNSTISPTTEMLPPLADRKLTQSNWSHSWLWNSGTRWHKVSPKDAFSSLPCHSLVPPSNQYPIIEEQAHSWWPERLNPSSHKWKEEWEYNESESINCSVASATPHCDFNKYF